MKDHPSHLTRYSDSSLYDEVCVNCGATDASGDDRLKSPCPDPNGITRGSEANFKQEYILDSGMILVSTREPSMELKSWKEFFGPIVNLARTSDMRSKKDRVFHVGQKIRLREYDFAQGKYTGRTCNVLVTHIISNDTPCALSSNALDRDHVVLSIKVVP